MSLCIYFLSANGAIAQALKTLIHNTAIFRQDPTVDVIPFFGTFTDGLLLYFKHDNPKKTSNGITILKHISHFWYPVKTFALHWKAASGVDLFPLLVHFQALLSKISSLDGECYSWYGFYRRSSLKFRFLTKTFVTTAGHCYASV